MKKKLDIRTLTQLALMIAVELIMAYTPLGMVPIGPINASLLTIPVAIGAMVLGPAAGALMGLIFGLTSFINALQGKSVLGAALMNASPVGYFVQAVVGRVLMGLCCALLFRALKAATKGKRIKLCCAIGGLSAALLNTFFYMGFMMLLFYNTEYIQATAERLGAGNPLTLVIAMVGIQGLVEAAVCCVVSTLVTLPLLKLVRNNKSGKAKEKPDTAETAVKTETTETIETAETAETTQTTENTL